MPSKKKRVQRVAKGEAEERRRGASEGRAHGKGEDERSRGAEERG